MLNILSDTQDSKFTKEEKIAFAKTLPARMIEADITAIELARYAKISNVTVSRIVRGRVKNPQNKNVASIERVLKGFGV